MTLITRNASSVATTPKEVLAVQARIIAYDPPPRSTTMAMATTRRNRVFARL